MLTYMLEEPGMTDEEYRDNMYVTSPLFFKHVELTTNCYRVVFFIAGHVCILRVLGFVVLLS